MNPVPMAAGCSRTRRQSRAITREAEVNIRLFSARFRLGIHRRCCAKRNAAEIGAYFMLTLFTATNLNLYLYQGFPPYTGDYLIRKYSWNKQGGGGVASTLEQINDALAVGHRRCGDIMSSAHKQPQHSAQQAGFFSQSSS